MIVVTHKYSSIIQELENIPPSMKREYVLTRSFKFSDELSIYGEVKHLIWIYDNVYMLHKIDIGNISEDIVLICDLGKIYFIVRELKTLNVKFIFDSITKESIVKMVCEVYSINSITAKHISKFYNYNLRDIINNENEIGNYINGSDILKSKVNNYTYKHVLLYLCGDNKITMEMYIQTLSKYRYSNAHIVKYIRAKLKMYIDVYFKEEDCKSITDKNDKDLLIEMSNYLNIEVALKLYNNLENYSCIDLLKEC